MSLRAEYDVLRDAINDCIGWRILDDDDVIERTDETVCASMVMSLHFGEDWHALSDDFDDIIGHTVAEANDPNLNREADARERLFRRKVTS